MITLNNKSLYITILSLVFLFCLPIIIYNGYYIDDNIRIITGNPDWTWVGRTFADYLMISLSLNKHIDDFSPIPLIIGLSIFSYVLYYSIKRIIPNPTLINIMPFLFIIVNPFFMQNLTYKFDSLPMILALSCSVLAFFINMDNKLKEWSLRILLLFVCLELYQPCANVFLILGACNIITNFKNNKNTKFNDFFNIVCIYAISTLLYMFFEKVIHPNIILDRGHIVPLNEIPSTIKENIKELLKMSYFLISKAGIIIFVIPIILYWAVNLNSKIRVKSHWLNKAIYVMAPIIIILSIWGPLIIIKEKISLPRELPTIGVLLFLNGWIIVNSLKKIKIISYIPIAAYCSIVLFCGLFINTLKIQDSFNNMIYDSLYLNITNDPILYNVKEIKINGNVPINSIFSRKVKENPYFYTLTMATPEWVSRAILIRKGLKQVKISFDGNDKNILKEIVKNKIKSSVNNQNYIIYKFNDITYVWFK